MKNNLKILFFNKKLHEKKWNKFIEKRDVSFENTLIYLDSMELNNFKNKSILVLNQKNEIKGIFLLLEEKFFFLKRYKSSGFLGDIDFDEIFPKIKKKLAGLGVYIQMNTAQQKGDDNKLLAYHFVLNLKNKTEQNIWKNDLNKKSRNMIRKAEKSGLKVKISDSKDELKKFYPIYLEKMKKFGTKPHTLHYMKFLIDNFPDFNVLNVYLNGKVIAGGTVYIHKGNMANQFAASLENYVIYAPNNFLYWNMIKLALEKKCSSIDYGPSLITDNVAKFKISMGGKPVLFEEHLVLNKYWYWLFRNIHRPILKLKKVI